MADLSVSPSTDTPTVDEPLRFAGFWIRVGAYLIDTGTIMVISIIAVFLSVIPLAFTHRSFLVSGQGMEVLGNLIGSVIQLIYILTLTASPWQATLGKRWLGIYVQTDDGHRLRALHVFGREAAKIVSAITAFIGFMMVGWTRQKTALHDRIAETRVVYGRKPEGIGRIKSPAVALLWSLAISGGGQFYNREYLKGVVFLAANIGLWMIWLGWVPWIWSISDAYKTANRQSSVDLDNI